jgi:2-octaprenyl-6-methoxyphenol hydroxylase
VAPRAEPILDMAITDSKLDDAVRPVFLTFAGDVQPGEPFAHMIQNGDILAALVDKAKQAGVTLLPTAVADFDTDANGVAVRLASGAVVRARLLVAADGARSRIRERAGIQSVGWSYGQSAIATTVAHERPHNGRAEEHFLPAGPFAILPMTGNRSSLVWTEAAGLAPRLLALAEVEFAAELRARFGEFLGTVEPIGPRWAYPLALMQADRYTARRLALIGEAAHVIHPIAGQGLNIGIRDVAALAEAIVDARRLGLDIGDDSVLERYQRWRRLDAVLLAGVTDGLNRLFSNTIAPVKLARDIGLAAVNRLPPLKRLLMRHAMGTLGGRPRLARGELL